MNYIKVTNSKLSVDELSNMVSSPRCGAISLFVGTTRDSFQDHKVLQLEYEAYEPMAIKAMSGICGEVRKKWPSVEHIAIYHRLGIVPVQEASVVIAVSSPHRPASLEAVGFTIQALKASVPIWKKEVYESDRPAEWKENTELIPSLSKRVKTEAAASPPKDIPPHSTDLDPVGHMDFIPINSKLVQIKADDKEVQRRMLRFIERKREDLNAINNREFCNHGTVPEEENSCARVDALVFRKSDGNSHLRFRRVFNQWGPQSRGNKESSTNVAKPPANPYCDAESARKDVVLPVQTRDIPISMWKMCTETKPQDIAQLSAIDERLRNAEQHLRIDGPLSKDVYERLQKIEARILYLEGISPEYASFWGTQGKPNSGDRDTSKPRKKKTYTPEDLERKIQEYQREIS